MKKFLFIALCTLYTVHLTPLSAATYYASPTGGGDGKSYANPITFGAGIKLLKNPGDTLYLFSGQYDLGNVQVQNLVGTADKRIVISGYDPIDRSGHYSAILDFRTTAYGTRGLQIRNTCSYIHVKNLTLRYSGKNNLYNEGNYNLFENLDIYGSADTGCQMKGDASGSYGGHNIIKNVDSHDNFDYELDKSGNLTACDFGGNADGFADKQFTGAGNHYIGCRAWNNSDDGWDFFQRVSTSQTVIEHCICYRNGPASYDMTNHPRYETDKAWFDQFKNGKTVTDADGNSVYVTLEAYPNMGNGNGFKLGGANTEHNALVHHCLSVGNTVKGFDQNSDAGELILYNNTGYLNSPDYGFYNPNGCQLTIHNCISYKSKSKNSFNSGLIKKTDHNSWSSGFSVSNSDFVSLDTTLLRMYRTSDGSLSTTNLLRLASGSLLIDAGVDVGLSYNGTAPDLGCFETDGTQHDPEPEPEPEPQPEGTHAVAFVSIPQAGEDQPLISYLKQNKQLWLVELDATDAGIKTAAEACEVIVLGSKPASSAAGFAALKGIDKPIVLLKPWLLKTGAWGWGTAINTQDIDITITESEHPLFNGLTLTGNILSLFSLCTTNAITAISEWTNTSGAVSLAHPLLNDQVSAIAELPAGTNCNGTVLPKRLVMIGLSEYSLTDITFDGKRLVENAILYQLGLDIPTESNHQSPITNRQSSNRKYLHHGSLFIQTGDAVYDAFGRRMRP